MERNNKRKWFTGLALAATMMLTACGGNSVAPEAGGTAAPAPAAATGEQFTFKMGNAQKPEHPYNIVLEEFAKKVEERTNGSVKFELYPMSALGAEREMIEGMQLGTIDSAMVSTGPLGSFSPSMGVLDLPFLFTSREQVYNVLDGEIGQGLLSELEKSNLVGLAWAENGFRHITNSKRPVQSPADLNGLKLRTMENEIHLEAFKQMGANPTPMAWTEALTGMQQGVVDGQENPLVIADTFKLYEMNQKYMTLTGHLYSPALIVFSKSSWDKLPAEFQAIVQEEAKVAADKERQLIVEADEKALVELKNNGVEIIENIDILPFQEAIKPVYEKYEERFGKELIDSILNTK
ncbi:TRAP transporter substrate-binding protein [Ammoniphilus sp. YIM 78166]|uniref:TRAP transporter substrate-binding protein n=1 Tax=Ammoniphilus sp. YIM 78166 TaxID=1644106 RepID=UPI00106F219D|nr:TRAP transporter substrate-binding protein [Ammoniphilus sp. YIM 78166]